MQKIKFVDIYSQDAPVRDKIKQSINEIIDSCKFIGGDYTKQLEEKWAAKVNQKYVVGCANGTVAIETAARALKHLYGSWAVNVPSATFIASAAAIKHAGLNVFLHEIDDTYTLDINKLSSITYLQYEVIMPVSLYGNCPDMVRIKDIRNKNVKFKILLDNSQGAGAKLNGKNLEEYADVTAMSTYPSKNLNGYTDSGLISTNNKDIYDFCRRFINHGKDEEGNHVLLGTNYRISEIAAASLLFKIDYLDEWNEKRRNVAARYRNNLKNVSDISFITERGSPVYHIMSIFCQKRDELRKFLESNGAECGQHYQKSCHNIMGYKETHLEKTDKWERGQLSIPCGPTTTEDEVDFISEKIIEFFENNQ